MRTTFITDTLAFAVTLNDSPAAQCIASQLPLQSRVTTWGDEIYFDTGINCPSGGETMELKSGDVGYWPPGRCLCVFFGPTPASTGPDPVPAGPVIVIGSTGCYPDELRRIRSGESIRMVKKGDSA